MLRLERKQISVKNLVALLNEHEDISGLVECEEVSSKVFYARGLQYGNSCMVELALEKKSIEICGVQSVPVDLSHLQASNLINSFNSRQPLYKFYMTVSKNGERDMVCSYRICSDNGLNVEDLISVITAFDHLREHVDLDEIAKSIINSAV
jgi:hypothetical protein